MFNRYIEGLETSPVPVQRLCAISATIDTPLDRVWNVLIRHEPVSENSVLLSSEGAPGAVGSTTLQQVTGPWRRFELRTLLESVTDMHRVVTRVVLPGLPDLVETVELAEDNSGTHIVLVLEIDTEERVRATKSIRESVMREIGLIATTSGAPVPKEVSIRDLGPGAYSIVGGLCAFGLAFANSTALGALLALVAVTAGVAMCLTHPRRYCRTPGRINHISAAISTLIVWGFIATVIGKSVG